MINVINLLIDILEINEEDNNEQLNIYDFFRMILLLSLTSLILFIFIIEFIITPIFIIDYLYNYLIKKDKILLNKNEIILKMNKLDEIKDDITSGEYLLECNRLMNLYKNVLN